MKSKIAICFLLSFFSGTTLCLQATLGEEKSSSLSELRAARKVLAHKKRFVANNDGCDCVYYPKDQDVSKELFLKSRTTALGHSQVNTLSYCTIGSGFGYFTHDTKAGELLTISASASGIAPHQRNITSDLIAMKTDPLRWVVEFGHEHDQEVFWSMRMNDTHDVVHRSGKPFFLYPKLKKDHPEWLIGELGRQTQFGDWSSVDYSRPEIRDLAFRYIEEVCQNYDVDGVDLDFFRHLCFFRSVALGRTASSLECDWMTDLMRRIRAMTEARGLERGRPILIAVRVPDSAEYSEAIGLDIDRWMKEGLIDILITTSYFRLNPWKHSIEMGRQHGVAVYPCLTDARVTGTSRFARNSVPTLRARAMNVWHSGAQGLYVFNHFDPNSPMWKELGDPETMRYKQKLYFASLVDAPPSRYLSNGDSYRKLSLLTPNHSISVTPDSSATFEIQVSDDVQAANSQGHRSKAILHLEVPKVTDPKLLEVKLNNHVLINGTAIKNWLDYELPTAVLQTGFNHVSITSSPKQSSQGDWNVAYLGDALPGALWKGDRDHSQVVKKIVEGALLIADRGTQPESYLFYRYSWGADVNSKAIVEARIKVVSGQSLILFGNGVSGERIIFLPDRIYLNHNNGVSYSMNTTDAFHDYRLEVLGTHVKVFVDGKLRLDSPRALVPRSGYSNQLAFGASNSQSMGESYWESVKIRTDNIGIHDAVISIDYPEK